MVLFMSFGGAAPVGGEHIHMERPFTEEDLDEMFASPGVYGVLCKPTREMYIGATSRGIDRRLAEHFRLLDRGEHYCPVWQARYQEYGDEGFEVQVLSAFVPDNQLANEEAACFHLWTKQGKFLNQPGDVKVMLGRWKRLRRQWYRSEALTLTTPQEPASALPNSLAAGSHACPSGRPGT